MHDFQHYRDTEFAASIAEGIYLNHAAASPSPARVQKAVCDAITLMGRDTETFFMKTLLPDWEIVRQGLARLMHVDPEWLAITRNTAHALSIVADGLDIQPGENAIVADCEYPAVVYPWYAQKWRGVETRLLAAGRDGSVTAEKLEPLIDRNTRAIALSWVQFGTGYRADLRSICDLAHAHGILVIVDVIQGLGALDLEPDLPLDVIATGAHKWLMAPHGCGGLYIAPQHLDRFRLVNIGAVSVVDVAKFDPLVFEPKRNTQRYEEGSPNGLGLAGLAASISLIEEVGIDRMHEQVLDLASYATEKLAAAGCHVDSPLDRAHQSGLVLFRHPSLDNETALQRLADARIRASIRGGKLRISPHFYNTTADIDAVIAALAPA